MCAPYAVAASTSSARALRVRALFELEFRIVREAVRRNDPLQFPALP
jgi:hypothetical protein